MSKNFGQKQHDPLSYEEQRYLQPTQLMCQGLGHVQDGSRLGDNQQGPTCYLK